MADCTTSYDSVKVKDGANYAVGPWLTFDPDRNPTGTYADTFNLCSRTSIDPGLVPSVDKV